MPYEEYRKEIRRLEKEVEGLRFAVSILSLELSVSETCERSVDYLHRKAAERPPHLGAGYRIAYEALARRMRTSIETPEAMEEEHSR